MNDLRSLIPTHIVRGALLRSDGVAVGLVCGGAPAWDLLAPEGKAQAGTNYHGFLTALNAPIDIYQVDYAPNVTGEITTLIQQQEETNHPLLRAVLGEMADYLLDLMQGGGSRVKQTIWAVTSDSDAGMRTLSSLDVTALVGRGKRSNSTKPTNTQRATLVQATERARRLTDAISALGGTPAPRLMEAEEIASLVYQCADPVRAQRYPLAGTLLDRVRRVVVTQPMEVA